MAQVIASVISAIALIAVAIIETRNARDRKRVEDRAERRAKESALSMELMSATCDLSMEAVQALRDGHTNGTLERRLKRAQKAQAAYDNFIKQEAAHSVSKD